MHKFPTRPVDHPNYGDYIVRPSEVQRVSASICRPFWARDTGSCQPFDVSGCAVPVLLPHSQESVPLPGSPREPHPIAEAARWVGILTTVGLEMVIPTLIGHWLDRRFGLRILTFVGLVLGFAIGLWNIVQIARQSDSQSGPRNGP